MALQAGLSLPRGAARTDPRIVDKDVEPIAVLARHVGEATHLRKRGKIRRQKNCRALASGLNLIDYLFASVAVPSVVRTRAP
jgi:hypothetical protein